MNTKLNNLLKHTHSPYSKVSVSAIVVTKDGKEFSGVNVENASFGATMCAERSAMFSAISSGVKPGEIVSMNLTSSLDKPLFPCGMCLQVMSEIMPQDAEVNIYNGEEVINKKLNELIPFAVKEESFEWK